jgi:carbonic anhydrase/acetyltransferase-like protein (isoleucine patch superfamily)
MRDPIILPFAGTLPTLAAAPVAEARSALIGRLTAGAGLTLGADTVIRADGHFVTIGDDFRLRDGATVHIAHDVYPTIIGDRVTVGRNAVVHACTVGDDVVIEDDVVILDGSVVGARTILAAGSVVFPRTSLEGGRLFSGVPAKPVREVTLDDVARAAASLAAAAPRPRLEPSAAPSDLSRLPPSAYVAATARLHGRVVVGEKASVWFGCLLDAGAQSIELGEAANVQDNTVIVCRDAPFRLGRGAVIGHNVRLGGCEIGEGALIGIGAIVAEGTVVEPGVLLAAGAETEPGQRLESGWLWAGRPARPLTQMDERKHAMIAATIRNYTAYAAAMRPVQEEVLAT